MGMLSWLFPSDEDKIAKAKRWMDSEEWADARLQLMGIEHPEAKTLLQECEVRLCQLNLDAAVSWAEAEDPDRVRHHFEVAENFSSKATGEAFRAARRQVREIRTEREEQKKREAEELARQAAANEPVYLDGMPETADEEAAARIALVVESYDPGIRETVGPLGSTFAQALIDMEDGRPDLAIQGLVELSDDIAVVRYERARAAYAMGDAKATIRELQAFAQLYGQHAPMGRHHSATFLATVLTEAGRVEDALALLRKERKKDPQLGAGLYAQLLELSGELEQAEKVLMKLIRTYSKDTGLYALLGRVRAKAGNRMGAMTTMEAGLEASKCKPGTCGYRPPDIRLIRGLATLYLEDGMETARALELAEQAAGLVQQPTWEDAYLQALAARASGGADSDRMVEALWAHTPDDERRTKLTKFLPPPAA